MIVSFLQLLANLEEQAYEAKEEDGRLVDFSS